MSWTYAVNAITDNKILGNALVLKLSPTAGDSFAGPKNLRAKGSVGPATHWFTNIPMRDTVYPAAQEFGGPGPYPILNGAGVDDATIAACKAVIVFEAGPRADIAASAAAFIDAAGFELVVQDPTTKQQ